MRGVQDVSWWNEPQGAAVSADIPEEHHEVKKSDLPQTCSAESHTPLQLQKKKIYHAIDHFEVVLR